MTGNNDSSMHQERTDYSRGFESSLRRRVAQAVEEDDELVASSVMYSLFSPSEIVAGAYAGHSLNLEIEEAVVCFVVARRAAADERAADKQALSGSVDPEANKVDATRMTKFIDEYSRRLLADS
jgi:hypothetical protein